MLKVGSLVRATESIACGEDVRVGDLGVVVDVSGGKNWTSCRVRFFHQAQENPWPVTRREIEHVEGR